MQRKKTIIGPIIRLTLVLVVCQAILGYFVFINRRAVSPTTFSNFAQEQILASGHILDGFIFFLFAQLLVYATYIIAIWAVTCLIKYLLNLSQSQSRLLGMCLWLLATVSVYFANQYYFPDSQFAFLRHMFGLFSHHGVNDLIFLILSTLLLVVGALAGLGFLKGLWQRCGRAGIWIIGLACFSVAATGYFIHTARTASGKSPGPNIIIIGIDSLRPNDLAYFGNDTSPMPYTDSLLTTATVFTQAYTPLGRTFPAWMSVLTGRDPKLNNARYNLRRQADLILEPNLAAILKRQGYRTIYAIDDRRFNNIDEDYGFTEVIGPDIGANDFILGTINDAPLTNLLMNVGLSRWLFPYNYANRAAHVSYYPQQFDRLLANALAYQSKKPLFLAVHYTLPHWPFSWGSSPSYDRNDPLRNEAMFSDALAATDGQIERLMTTLKDKGYLHNAIVVLLSDHGNGFGLSKESLTQQQNYQGKKAIQKSPLNRFLVNEKTIGHGTDLLNKVQNHVLLAFRVYAPKDGKLRHNTVGRQDYNVSLIDIAPSLLDYVNIKQDKMQGISLLQNILSKTVPKPPARNIFLETGFTLPGILVANPSIGTLLNQGLVYYNIEPETGLLRVKPELSNAIIKGKQRGVLRGDWLLVDVPDLDDKHFVILVNTKTGQWSDELSSAWAKQAPVADMQKALQNFYDDELNHAKQ
ncbi:MAG: hypothetical protein CMF50_07885 [Legionellales bacterium]|nr:hypothetical protein [Legionellales bacterium]|tara:strand:- start:6703 stop:8784 length:2082 start_codon:yes stop_codon:yes gene_type:complete